MKDPNYDHLLDAEGLTCPEPMMLIHRMVRHCESGDVLLIKSTDPATQRDLVQFCHFLGHQLIHQRQPDTEHWWFWLRKK